MRLNKSLSKRLLKPSSRNIFGNDSLGGALAYACIFKEKLDQSCHWLIKHKYFLYVFSFRTHIFNSCLKFKNSLLIRDIYTQNGKNLNLSFLFYANELAPSIIFSPWIIN